MIGAKSKWTLPILLAGFSQLIACAPAQVRDSIYLNTSDDDGHLRVTYRLALPTTGIMLARTPDESRGARWQFTSPDFRIAHLAGNDIIRRFDDAEFSSVKVVVPATYVPLPKDYAPFSPFSDGGLLIHSGRYQACAINATFADKSCEGPWSMEILAPPNAHILLNGRKYGRSAQWADTDDGTMLYVGTATPHSDSNFVGIVDPALPPYIARLMSTSLPRAMAYFSQQLPPLSQRPMLFVSYDPTYGRGYGRQGSTLPQQIFMHFYGPMWERADTDDNTAEEIIWFFAHEAGHLFQHGVTGTRESSWIHEGAAEAFAFRLLENLGNVSQEFLAAHRQQAFDGCRDALGSGTLTSAAERGSFSDYYQCGLIMFLAIDTTIRANSNDQQDLFDLWTTLISESNKDESWDTKDFLSRAESLIGGELAGQLLSLSVDKHDDPAEALARLGK